ncbi:MAG: anaerobic ribonucleoside-triphosphate reductase activating protein [Planctomycetota bacterium]
MPPCLRGEGRRVPVAGFLPSTLLEWEDRVSAAVALQGCNFRCPFCHSAGMVPAGPPEHEVPWEAVREHIQMNTGWIDGVVVSGGEPTIHAGLGDLLGRIRELELPVKLDTNGSAPAMLRELVSAGLVRHVALDVKALLAPEDYERATGNSGALDKVRESLGYLRDLAEGPVSYELRTTCVPGILGRGEEQKLFELARELAWARTWYLQAFRPVGCLDPEYELLPATDPEWLKAVAAECERIAPGCRVRGR